MQRLAVIFSTFALLILGCTLPQIGQDFLLPESDTCTPNMAWELYTVTVGDTLSDIAQRAESTVSELVTANCLTNASTLQIGQTLRVPRTPAVKAASNQRGNLAISVYSQPSGVHRLVAGNAATISWEGIPSEIKSGEATVEFVLILPSGEEQIIGTTTGVIDDARGGYASASWIVPFTPMTGARVKARVNHYTSNTLSIEIVILAVQSFTADRSTVQPGDTLTFNWSVSGGVGGETVMISDHTDFTRVISDGLPLNGSLSVTIPTPASGFTVDTAVFHLVVVDETGTPYTLPARPEVRLSLVRP